MIIKGNTVGTTMPRTNYEQTDNTNADYLNGKDVLDQKIADAKKAGADAQTAVADLETEVNKKASTATYYGTLLASNWGDSAPYKQTITVSGIKASDIPFAGTNLSDTTDNVSILEAWSMIGRITAPADNTIVAYCYEEAPTVDVPILLKVVR
jgi:hypothetical protein